jgi:hypothetical protein
MRDKLLAGALTGTILAIAACSTIGTNKGYVICNDLAANVTCPDNTANVVVSN